MFRMWVVFTSITITSMITSGLALSRSAINFSTSAMVSASARTINAFCEVKLNTFCTSTTVRRTVSISCISCGVVTLDR